MKNKILFPLLVFYTIACAISWPLFLDSPIAYNFIKGIGLPTDNPFLYIMWGPGIAAILSYLFFRNNINRKVSLFGKQVVKSLVFFLFPWVIFFVLNLFSPVSDEFTPFNFLLIIPFAFAQTMGEEIGWRGFLQDLLRPIHNVWRWMFVGVLWEFWHIRFIWISDDVMSGLVESLPFLGGSLLLSLLLGYTTERTKSIFVPIALHVWVNMLMMAPHWVTFVSVGLSIILWFYLIRYWDIKLRNLSSKSP